MESVCYKQVCSTCAGISLGRYIYSYGEMDTCDYCGKCEIPVMTIDSLLPRIYQSMQLYYESPEDYPHLQMPNYLSYTSDAIEDVDMELDDAREDFIFDLKKAVNLDDKFWLRKADIWTPFPEALKSSWQRFSEIVKKQWRYTYFLCGNDILDPASYSPLDAMKVICELLQIQNAFVTELPACTCIYRNRKCNIKFGECAKELGTAPSEHAKDNRFSPKGVPMFYGSLDEDTCELESSGNGTYSVTGVFHNAKSVRVLDLTNIPPVPRLYDDDFGFIPAYKFLHEFSNIISKNVADDDLEYIPTQIFTEFIRLQGLRQFKIRGIMYKSSKRDGGKNLVLFYTNDECKDKDDGTDCLVLDKTI